MVDCWNLMPHRQNQIDTCSCERLAYVLIHWITQSRTRRLLKSIRTTLGESDYTHISMWQGIPASLGSSMTTLRKFLSDAKLPSVRARSRQLSSAVLPSYYRWWLSSSIQFLSLPFHLSSRGATPSILLLVGRILSIQLYCMYIVSKCDFPVPRFHIYVN